LVYLTKQRGFTLVELVMVIVLLGILSATATPKFFSVSSYKNNLFFDDTHSALHFAQKLAITTNCNVQILIDHNRYTISRPAKSDRSQCTSTNPTDFSLPVSHPGTGEAYYTHAEKGVSLTANLATFYFNALGQASADVTLTVAGDKIISVVAATGFIYEIF
jgi:MSHA pilin protein MshC